MSTSAEEILKRLAETGYFQSIGHGAEQFSRTVATNLHVDPNQAFQTLVKAGYVTVDHGPNPHPADYIDNWRLTLTKEGLAVLLVS